MKPPNILLIMADQMRADCLGVVNPAIRTPHLDRLAREGARCDHAYPATPVCLPARAALHSGQYGSSTGATHNHTRLREDHPQLLGEVFARAGYATHFVGKSHLSSCHDPCSPESFPHIANYDHFDRWHGPWYGFQQADLAIGHTVERHGCGMHYGAWLRRRGVDLARFFGHHPYTAYGAWDLPEEHHNSAWAADCAIAGIDRAAASGRPFLSFVNFQDPHNPCLVPRPWATMYDPEALPRFGFKPGEPECFAAKPRFYRDILRQPGDYAGKAVDAGLAGAGNVSHLAWSQRQVQENAACYYAMTSLMDHHIGRILDHLDRSGLRDDTLVIFTSDHGDLLGDHGFWFKSLVVYEESYRTPFLVRWPGRIAAGTRHDGFISQVDLLPTLCAAAGIGAPEACEGVDLLPGWTGGAAVRRDVVIEERPEDGAWNQRILLDGDWCCAFYASHPDEGELYDDRNDPHHRVNLWSDPAHAATRRRCLDRILVHEMNKRPPALMHGRLFARG